jgi:3,4-dihydroxy 2-butanone 4-phosphate synthase/GTP cyclohydrolase II
VLARAGHTEAATDLAALAGRHSAGVICEVLSEDGSMARRPELMRFARRHRLPVLTIAELIAFRDRSEPRVRRRCERLVTTTRGDARAAVFDDLRHAGEHVALVVGDAPSPGNPVPVHVRRTCTLGDALHVACSCRRRLERALDELSTRGHGRIGHLAGDGTSCDAGTPLDGRLTAAILDDLGVTAVDLVGATPGLSRTLSEHGIEVARRADRRLRAIELPATSVA